MQLHTPRLRLRYNQPERSCSFQCCFIPVFACLVVGGNDFITTVWATSWASVPVAAVVLKYIFRFLVVAVHRGALSPPLAAVPTHCMMYVNFSPLSFLIKPPKGFESCLRRFDMMCPCYLPRLHQNIDSKQ